MTTATLRGFCLFTVLTTLCVLVCVYVWMWVCVCVCINDSQVAQHQHIVLSCAGGRLRVLTIFARLLS